MCLAAPARVTQVGSEHQAEVDLHGNRVQVSLVLTPDAGVDDWVLVHAGFAIAQLDEEEAARTWAVLREPEPATAPDEPAVDAGSWRVDRDGDRSGDQG